MKKITPALSLLALLTLTSFAADEKKASRTVALKYMEATTAYEKLKESFPEITEIVRRIQIDKNSMTLKPSHARADELRKKLAEIDKRPKQILLSAVISEAVFNASDGTMIDKVISRPTVFTLEGKPAVIGFDEHNKAMSLTVTASSLPAAGDGEPKQILLRSVMSLKPAGSADKPAKERVWVDYLHEKIPMEIIQYSENGKLRKITIRAQSVAAKEGE